MCTCQQNNSNKVCSTGKHYGAECCSCLRMRISMFFDISFFKNECWSIICSKCVTTQVPSLKSWGKYRIKSYLPSTIKLWNNYTPRKQSFVFLGGGSILVSPCPSPCLSVSLPTHPLPPVCGHNFVLSRTKK